MKVLGWIWLILLTIVLAAVTLGCVGKRIAPAPPSSRDELGARLSRRGDNVTIHYPPGVVYQGACIATSGRYDDRFNPGSYTYWFWNSCWRPYYITEQYNFRVGTYEYRVSVWSSAFWNDRPELWSYWTSGVRRTRPIEDEGVIK